MQIRYRKISNKRHAVIKDHPFKLYSKITIYGLSKIPASNKHSLIIDGGK